MLLGVVLNYALFWATFLVFKVSSEWKLSCYNEKLSIVCGYHSKIVVHDAHFGFFERTAAVLKGNYSCLIQKQGDCWTDVSTYISGLCSGHSTCETNVHYSRGLSHTEVSQKCPSATDARPSLFVEYDCISDTLFTKIFAGSRVDSEQVGGYLTTLDYTESLHGGTEWRSHLADALCQAGHEQLPARFTLPAPRYYEQHDAVTFVLRLKDISLTLPAEKNGFHGSRENQYTLSTELDCLVPEKPCHQDYLEISAKLPSSSRPAADSDDGAAAQKASELLLPIARFCLVNASTKVPKFNNAPDTALESREDSANGELVFGHGSPQVGRVYGPLPPAVELQFTSNLNLLNTGEILIPGKGILIEYIALFCTPISPPAGSGLVDYRFQAHPHSTVAYAEIFCPSDRWLEPQPPTDSNSPDDRNHTIAWWLKRRRHATHVCDHHQKSWIPNQIPAACLTDTELNSFVANVEMLMQNRGNTAAPVIPMPIPVPTDRSEPGAVNRQPVSTPVPMNDSSSRMIAPIPFSERVLEKEKDTHLKAGTSVAVGAVLGFLVCLLAVVLIVYSLRHKLVAHYHKTVSFPVTSGRLTRSSSSFNPSIHSAYPTVNSVDWRRKLGRNRWDFLKPWQAHTWSQNLSGTYPDLPRQTILNGTMSTGQKTPETIVVRSGSTPSWRIPSLPNGQSSFSLAPGAAGSHPFDPSQPTINGSPWLRTTSTTHLTHPAGSYMNSSGDISNPFDGYPFHNSWWPPCRRTLKKQHRLYMHLQRRREAQFQSQRRLMESSATSNGSSSQIALAPSSLGLVNSSSRDSNSLIDPRTPLTNPDRPMSQRTTRSSRTFTTSDGGTVVTPGGTEPLAPPLNSAVPVSTPSGYPPQFGYANWDWNGANYGQSTSQPYQEIQPPMEQHPPSTGGDTLPWKSTPPTSNSFSNRFRRFSSFLRNLNGSLTPPRSARRSQLQLINQIHPQSMSTLDSPKYFQSSPVDATNQNNVALNRIPCFPFPPANGFPRARSESGSMRLGRGLGLRSVFNIPISRDSTNMYNLEMEDSLVGDPLSGSTTTTTRTSVIPVAPSGPRTEDWAHYPDWAQAGVPDTVTMRGQVPMPPYPPPPSTQAPSFLTQVGQPVPESQSNQSRNSAYSPTHPPPQAARSPEQENPHCNDPYLEPVSVKRLRAEETAAGGTKPSRFSDCDAQPSATSSAISSLVFADSVVDDEPDPASCSTTQPVTSHLPASSSSSTSRPAETILTPAVGTSRGLDYVTYDLARSGTSGADTLTVPPASTTAGPKPVSGLEGELLATQLEMNTAGDDSRPARRPKKGANQNEAAGSSRPLSEAMISNHYYDANEPGLFYPETPTPVAPAPPPRVDLMLPRQPPPHLPPLWGHQQPGMPGPSEQTRPSGLTTLGQFGSMDSLYETVDQFPGHSFGAEQTAREQQQTNVLNPAIEQTSATMWLAQNTAPCQRQRMALPPTPDALQSVRAPMATGDEVSDAE